MSTGFSLTTLIAIATTVAKQRLKTFQILAFGAKKGKIAIACVFIKLEVWNFLYEFYTWLEIFPSAEGFRYL